MYVVAEECVSCDGRLGEREKKKSKKEKKKNTKERYKEGKRNIKKKKGQREMYVCDD